MDFFAERRIKVSRHAELPWLWRTANALSVMGVVWSVYTTVAAAVGRRWYGSLDLTNIGGVVPALAALVFYAMTAWGSLRLRKWTVLPVIGALAFGIRTRSAIDIALPLVIILSYVYLRMRIKFSTKLSS